MDIERRDFMIDKQDGHYVLICDVCEEDEVYFDDFNDAVDYKKANGWRSSLKRNGEWEDVCPECRKVR